MIYGTHEEEYELAWQLCNGCGELKPDVLYEPESGRRCGKCR